MNRRTLVNLVFFLGVFLLMLVWAANNIVTIDRLERPYEITGDFAQAAGVQEDAEVTYLGVHYGRVSDVERHEAGVRITMKIDRGKQIPAGSVARIFRKSAVGEPYIDFVPAEGVDVDAVGTIEPGDHVPIERTTVPLELADLLRSASELVSSIDPADAGSLVHELSVALDGRGEALRTLTTSIDELTASFVERTDQLDRLAENSTRVTRVVADHRLSLGRSIENLRAVTDTLAAADGDVRRLLELGPDFLGTTADLVADQKRNLDCLLTDLAPVLSALSGPDQLAQLQQLLARAPLGFGLFANTVEQRPDGPWVRVQLTAPVYEPEAPQYFPRKALPAVPTVAACDSTLTAAAVASGAATGADIDIAAAPAIEAIAATGGEPHLVVALLLAAGGAATVHIRRRSGSVR